MSTEEFKGRLAHFKDATSGKIAEEFFFDTITGPLEERDLIEIKKEIMKGPLPRGLKQLVQDIEIL